MDIELARTFLAIISTGSFIRAAEQLNVAQTTVSTRVRTLEERLGTPLFVRNKAGASLTPAGEQFLRYAPALVQLWQQARQRVAIPPGHRSVLTIGSEISLWQPLLLNWVIWMRRTLSDVALRVHIDVPGDLINQVAGGFVDIAVVYAPPQRPGLKVDLLLEERLVFVTTDPQRPSTASADFVSVDWGPDFAREYASIFPAAESPGLTANLGPFALSYILEAGGSGYFRMHTIEPYLASRKLHLVPGMPQFSYPIYVVRPTNSDDSAVNPVLEGLRAVASGAANDGIRSHLADAKRGEFQ